MKRLIGIVITLALILSVCPAFAAKGGEKGASAQAIEHASDQAIFNRVSDWFATIGKSKEEKAKILQERKAKRAAQRAEKAVQEAEEETKKAEEAQLKEKLAKERAKKQQEQEQAQARAREREKEREKMDEELSKEEALLKEQAREEEAEFRERERKRLEELSIAPGKKRGKRTE